MCGDSWQIFAANCLYNPPRWFNDLVKWWDWHIGLLLLLLAVSSYQFFVLGTQDRPTHMRLGWIREKPEQYHREGNRASRYLTDYRIYTFLVQIVGTAAAVFVLITWRNPLNLVDWLGAKTIPWQLSSDGVTEMLQMLRLIYVSVLMWIAFSSAALAILIVDPYGYHRYSLTPLSMDLTITGDPGSSYRLEVGKSLTTRNPCVYFSQTGNILCLNRLSSEAGWIKLSFIPSTGLLDHAKLQGSANGHNPTRFVHNGSVPNAEVERGKEFHIGESPGNKILFS